MAPQGAIYSSRGVQGDPTAPGEPVAEPAAGRGGEHERRLARGSLAQQLAQVLAALSTLAVITALGRRLSLAEFGVYGLVLSFATYLNFVQGSVDAAATRELARATDQRDRDRAFTLTMLVYVVLGAVAAVLIGGVGIAALGLFDIPSDLRDEARLGVLSLAVVTLVGWPAKTFQDVLRGSQLFTHAAVADMLGYVVMSGVLLALIFSDAQLWLLIGVAGAIPLAIGLCSAAIVVVRRLRFRFRASLTTFADVKSFTSFSFYVMASAASDLLIYALDRAVLAVFRSAATVGLYEAAVRPSNMIRQLYSSIGFVVFPAASRYAAEGDEARMRELLLRGTRYITAATVPFAVTLMALAEPILVAWLGERYEGAAVALTILVTYWLVNASAGVGSSMLMAAGRVRLVAGLSWSIALTNLALSLILTPLLGLEGVVLGTTIAYVSVFPFFIHYFVKYFSVTVRDFAREAWIPAYSLGAVLALALVALRAVVGLDSLAVVLVVAVGGVIAYFIAYYAIWLNPSERRLARGILRRA